MTILHAQSNRAAAVVNLGGGRESFGLRESFMKIWCKPQNSFSSIWVLCQWIWKSTWPDQKRPSRWVHHISALCSGLAPLLMGEGWRVLCLIASLISNTVLWTWCSFQCIQVKNNESIPSMNLWLESFHAFLYSSIDLNFLFLNWSRLFTLPLACAIHVLAGIRVTDTFIFWKIKYIMTFKST